MHLVETYATNCGLKIDKPHLTEKLYPLDVDKYITFHPFSKPCKNYDYWQTVLDLINPILDAQNIKILQLGVDGEPLFGGCEILCGGTSANQVAYIMRNSMLHLGVDSFPVHIGSIYNKQMVVVYPMSHLQNMRPYWGDEENYSLLLPDTKDKPSFNLDETPKTVNEIPPEKIAKEVCRRLGLDFHFPYETIYVGAAFHLRCVENIPNQVVNPRQLNVDTIYYRMDLEFNEAVLSQQLEVSNCCIVTDQPIAAELLASKKQRINEVVYIVTENDDPNFPRFLESQNINYQMMSFLPKEKVNERKIDYMDLENAAIITVKRYEDEEKEIKEKVGNIDDLYHISSRLLLSKGASYYGEAGLQVDDPVDFYSQVKKVQDTPIFWQNLHKELILKKVD